MATTTKPGETAPTAPERPFRLFPRADRALDLREPRERGATRGQADMVPAGSIAAIESRLGF